MYQCGQRMNNFIERYPQVISKEQCNGIIHEFKHDNNKKLGKLGASIVDFSRKHSTDIRCRFNHTLYQQYNNIIQPALKGGLQLYTGKYEFMMELPSWNISNEYNIQYYDDGQGYKVLHCEHSEASKSSIRILAWMIYLNDAQCGTVFPHQDITLIPKQGDLWVWPAFWTHAHRGEVPNIGDKYIATGWCEFTAPNPFEL